MPPLPILTRLHEDPPAPLRGGGTGEPSGRDGYPEFAAGNQDGSTSALRHENTADYGDHNVTVAAAQPEHQGDAPPRPPLAATAGAPPGVIDFHVVPVARNDFVRTAHLVVSPETPSDEAMATGRAGEAAVFQYIRDATAVAELPGLLHGPAHDVVWANQGAETGRPYDITYTGVNNRGKAETYYVEVKTTASVDKPIFEISPGELDFARHHPQTYLILRLFGVGARGTPERVCKLVVMTQPWDAIVAKSAQMYLRLY